MNYLRLTKIQQAVRRTKVSGRKHGKNILCQTPSDVSEQIEASKRILKNALESDNLYFV